VTHHKDKVPRVPVPTALKEVWEHFGPEYYITKQALPPTQTDIVRYAEEENPSGESGRDADGIAASQIFIEHRDYFIEVSGNTGC
jgi:hypothetical protein